MRKIVFDLAVLISRVTIGVIFLTHGLAKWQNGMAATSAAFEQSGVPLPHLTAPYTAVTETAGGALLIIGLLVRLSSLALLLGMLGAIVFIHGSKGVMVQNNGWELVGALAVVCLLFLVLGGGRIAIDAILRRLFARRSDRHARPPRRADLGDSDMREIDALVSDDPPRDTPPRADG
jgi:putative oxidoreductase